MSVSISPNATAPAGEFDAVIELSQQLADDLARRWQAGERPLAEEYLKNHPVLAERADAALEIVYEEICQRREMGEDLDVSAWFARFPQWRSSIDRLLACHQLLEDAGDDAWFPQPGESFGEFELLLEFGRGAHGRVYLARQPALADRPVVLKLSALSGQEHLSLARLQHTYIMPLYWAQDNASSGLRALCMPYFGGSTLSLLLDWLAETPPGRRSGADLLAALIAADADQPLAPQVQGPVCRFFEKSSYVEAVCFIGACLADALDYAHERGIIHHDLKPSNVLIAADGQPLLLDFHLAQPPLEAGATDVAWLGGTPGYMAPEHEAALEAMQRRQPIPQRVDGQADVYSLAALLCEALAGEPPPATKSLARWLRRKNSEVSTALADLIAKCMADNPAERYPSASALAADLRRHLTHQPLQEVRNRSLAERWAKWRRRRPYALWAGFLTLTLVAAYTMIAATARQRRHDAERALVEAEADLNAGRFALAHATIKHGLSLLGDVPWKGDLWNKLHAANARAVKGQDLQRLHTLVDELRRQYGPQGLPPGRAEALERDAADLWKERQRLLDQRDGQVSPSSALAADLLDLCLFWATLQERRAAEIGPISVACERIAVLQEAERLVGERLIVCRELERLAKIAGDDRLALAASQKAAKLTPASGWEHYALGRSDLNAGKLEQADVHFRAAVEMNPKDLWPNFYHARTAYELKNYEEAATAFTVCIVLSDGAAEYYYNRGLANEQLGRNEAARHDFDRALDLDPTLGAAVLERGMLARREGRFDDAVADLKRALASGADTAGVAYEMALAYAAHGDRAKAIEQLDLLFAKQPEHEGGRKLADSLKNGER